MNRQLQEMYKIIHSFFFWQVTELIYLVEMDLMGKLLLTDGGNGYMCYG